jgi:hypothetical protein
MSHKRLKSLAPAYRCAAGMLHGLNDVHDGAWSRRSHAQAADDDRAARQPDEPIVTHAVTAFSERRRSLGG